MLWALVVGILLVIAFIFTAIAKGWIGYVPPIEELENPNLKFATEIISDDGKMLGTWSLSKENRVFVGYDQLSEDIMHSGADNPVVNGATTVQDALFVITDKGLGAVSVVDDNEIMIGVLTDGDIRRGLSKGIDFLQRPVTELMTRAPKTITKDKLAAQALHLMESNSPKPITVLPVIDEERRVIGLLHMTDLVRESE